MRVWTTSIVDPKDRLAFWVDVICEAFLEMDCDSSQAHRFDGELACIPHARMNVNRVQATSQDVYRTPREIAASAESPFYLISDTAHGWTVRQDGETARLRPGDAVLVDASRPYAFHFTEGVTCLSLQIPRQTLAQWLPEPEARGLRCTRHDQGWGTSVAALSHQLVRDLNSAHDWHPDGLVEHVGALLCAALGPVAAAPKPAKADLNEQALRLMQAQLATPGLTAAAIAGQLGISSRTLHRLFATCGETFHQRLQRLRLDRAASMLAQPRLRHVLTAEIGRRCGFADASHFARVFQRRYGMGPSAWRS